MSAMHSTVSCGLSQVSVTARMSIVLEINKPLSDAVLSRTDRTFVVANRMLRLTASPGLSPASSRNITNLNVGVQWGIGSVLRLKQRLMLKIRVLCSLRSSVVPEFVFYKWQWSTIYK